MATSNNRDVRLGIEIATAGEDDVKRLAAAVRALGKEGDPAAAEFNRLADQLDRLGRQAGAVQSVQALSAAVDQLAVADTAAAAAAQTATTRFQEQAAATTVLREAQAAAVAEVTTARAAFNELRAELDRQVIAGRAAGLTQKELAKATEEARLNVVEQGLALKTRNAALTEANAALRTAEAAESKLRASSEATARASTETASALLVQTTALDKAQSSAAALGLNITELAAAEAGLRDQLRQTIEAAQAEAASVAAGAEAMQLLEQAARETDRQMEALSASLRETEQATRQYTTATAAAAGAGAEDAAAAAARVRAAEALIASERELTAAQRTLANERDRNRTAVIAEAQALVTQARAAAESRAAVAALTRETAAMGDQFGRVGTLAEQAFGQTGVRSLQAIDAEVDRVERSMALLERQFRAGKISADDLARALSSAQVRLATLNREAQTIPALPGQFERISASIQGVISRFGALGAAIATVGVAVKPVLDATIALQQMERVLTTVTGSSEKAKQQIEFLRVVSRDSGQQFDKLGESYAKFAASALQSGLSIEQTQAVFKSVALAAGNLGLSTDQAKRALEALSQIASKGTVSMEELRQQLGDALPGVLPLLAKELGLTQAELNKVVESGQLLASEAIPAIGRAMFALQPADGIVNGMVATWNRFINVIKQAGTTLVEGPIGNVAGVVLTSFAGVIRDVTTVAVFASEGLRRLGETIGVVAAGFANGIPGIRGIGDELERLSRESGDRLGSFIETAYGAGEATKKLGEDVTGLGTSFAKLSLDQQKAIDTAALAAQSAEKNVQAKKAEAEATATLANLIGDETTKRAASVEGARASALAAEQQAAADYKVVAALEAAKAATEAKAAAEGIGRDAIQSTIEALDTKIAKATADAEKTQAQADAARAHALALDLAAKSAQDNSKRIDELKAAVRAAELALYDKIRAMEKDEATSADVKRAATDLAAAKGLLRDAIDDVTKALDAQIAAMKAEAAVAEAGIKLEIEKAKNAASAAAAAGNEAEARRQLIRVVELQQSLTVAGIEVKRQEAAATLEAIAVQEAELRLSGQMTPELEAQIKARRASATAMLLESETTREANKLRAAEVKALADGTGAWGQNTGAIDLNTGAKDRNTLSTNNLRAALVGAAADAERLGVTLRGVQTSAQGGTEGAILAFERLKTSGKASADELQSAFVNMANEVIRSNSGVVPEWLKIEAEAQNVTIAVDAAGNAFAVAGEAGENAGRQVGESFRGAVDGINAATGAVSAFSNAARAAHNAANLSTQKSSFGDGFSATGQVNVPNGATFDSAAFARDEAAFLRGQGGNIAPNPNNPRYLINPATGGSVGPGVDDAIAEWQKQQPPVGPSGAGTVKSNHTVTINFGGKQTVVGAATQQDAVALSKFFAELELAAARSGP